MNYYQVKKLDEESLGRMKEPSGPVDECICSLLAGQPGNRRSSIRNSIKKAIDKVKHGRQPKGIYRTSKGQSAVVPISFKGERGGQKSTKEIIKHKGTCGRCGCDTNDLVLKHSYAKIRITSPDITSFCPCPSSDCMPGKDSFRNNVKVTVAHLKMGPKDNKTLHQNPSPNPEDLETSSLHQKDINEPNMSEKNFVSNITNTQCNCEEN